MDRKCIVFAGVVGSSKSPIANYLSTKLSLPIFNNDLIRTEVKEDLLKFSKSDYEKRRDERLNELLNSGKSFIYDASIDRRWDEFQELLDKNNYSHFIISLNLSYTFLNKIYRAKEYKQWFRLEELIDQHNEFLKHNSEIVGIEITDDNFQVRLNLVLEAVQDWLK